MLTTSTYWCDCDLWRCQNLEMGDRLSPYLQGYIHSMYTKMHCSHSKCGHIWFQPVPDPVVFLANLCVEVQGVMSMHAASCCFWCFFMQLITRISNSVH